MKKCNFKSIVLLAIAFISLSSCTSLHRTMREANTRVELSKKDFTLSEQITAEAHSTKVFGIDWQRIFKSKTGAIEGSSNYINKASIPVIGNYLANTTANYSLYELITNNPGYDVVFYPQYETKMIKPFLGLGFIYNKTTVKTTARLAKLNK